MITVPVVAQTDLRQREVIAFYRVINVVVNRVSLGADTLLFNDTTYVPLRQIAENLGATVDYDPITRTATITTSAYQPAAAFFEYFTDIPTFQSITGVSDINIFEHDASRLRFSISKTYASDYEFLQYMAALTDAGFMDEIGQDLGSNGTIILIGEDAQIVVSMLGPSFTFSIVRTN